MQIRSNFVTAALVVVAVLSTAACAQAQQIQVNKENRTIAVSTTDTATADADIAVVHVGFQLFAPDEKTVYANASKTSNAIAKALADAGVKKESMESVAQNIARVQQYENQNIPEAQKAQRQFTVTQSWDVKTSAKEAAAILNTAVQVGANQSGQIEWSVADADGLESQAAGKALKRAQEIATRMAQGLGTKLGPLVYASNQNPEAPRPIPMVRAMSIHGALAKTDAVEPLAINAQKVTRSATVYAVFAIE